MLCTVVALALGVMVKLPPTSDIGRAVPLPEMRSARLVPLLSRFKVPPVLTVKAIVLPSRSVPLPFRLKVPWWMVIAPVGVRLIALVMLRVPVPYLMRLANWFAVVAVAEVVLLFRLMMLLPAALKVSVRPVVVTLLMPPLMFKVPAAAPMTASNGINSTPFTVLLPEMFCNWPPKLMPPVAWLPTPWRLMVLATVTPLVSCSAAPTAVEFGAM